MIRLDLALSSIGGGAFLFRRLHDRTLTGGAAARAGTSTSSASSALSTPLPRFKLGQIGIVIDSRQSRRIRSTIPPLNSGEGRHTNHRLRVTDTENAGSALLQHFDFHFSARESESA